MVKLARRVGTAASCSAVGGVQGRSFSGLYAACADRRTARSASTTQTRGVSGRFEECPDKAHPERNCCSSFGGRRAGWHGRTCSFSRVRWIACWRKCPDQRVRYALGSRIVRKGSESCKETDRFSFKVPTLRNVEMTYPYFDDGAADTLPQAVDVMGRLPLGKTFTKDENAKIVAFLKTLTGDQPRFVMPILPPSSDATPRPNPFK
jgi:hypothetical protein